jgi:phospholipase/lecithinase/hemolysin
LFYAGITNALQSCCGNGTVPCGRPGCSVCNDPSTYGSWDGTHPTEAVYKVIADGVLHGPYASPCSYRQDLPSELTASVLRLLMMAGA